MRVLLDQGTPVPLRRYLPHHSVVTVFEKGWSTLENGELLRAAEAEHFEILITTDQKLKHQQNLSRYRLAIVVLMTTRWPLIESRIADVVAAVDTARQGDLVEVAFLIRSQGYFARTWQLSHRQAFRCPTSSLPSAATGAIPS